MQPLMLGGGIVAGIGLVLIMLSLRWFKPWGQQYRSVNGPVTVLGILLFFVGAGTVVFMAYQNGQLG